MIRVTSQRDGYWRAGVQHFTGGVVHEDDAFTEKQIEAMRADPVLAIETGVDAPAEPADPEDEDAAIETAIRTLGRVDFDGSGKPRLPSVRLALKADHPGLAARFDVSARDRVFANMTEAGFVVPEPPA